MNTPIGTTERAVDMNPVFKLYGWHLSYYTGKVLCYLRYKRIAHTFIQVSLWTLMYRIKRKTGVTVMPVLVTDQDEWIQDSSVIMDRMEALYPQPSIQLSTPVQRFAASLMEAWGDEWWVPIAMHTRWTHSENYTLFEKEAGASLLPGFPKVMQRFAVARTAKLLRSYLGSVGVRAEQYALMDEWTHAMLDLLDQHFAKHDYLFGNQPSVGDFGLVGTMYGHLGRDPWPKREMVAPRANLRAWIDRMAQASPLTSPLTSPLAAQKQAFLPDDEIAPTLTPVFQIIMKEFVPMLQGIAAQVTQAVEQLPQGAVLPRVLNDLVIPMGEGYFHRRAMPYSLWMAQRTLDVYRAMSPDDQRKVQQWLDSVGGRALLTLQFPRLRRVGLSVMPESHQEQLSCDAC